MIYEREDWTQFRSINTLSSKAGVGLRSLGGLVIKEIADNALDAGMNVTMTEENGWVVIEDDGPGLPKDRVATLFSIRRPLTSSKIIRLPMRGALGNGLRVVMGAVFASDGQIHVETGGAIMDLRPQNDGTTQLTDLGPSDLSKGMRVSIKLGSNIPGDAKTHMAWANIAIIWAKFGETYQGKTSPWWYDADALFELLQAAGDSEAAALLAEVFNKITLKAAKLIVGDKTCKDLTRSECGAALRAMREVSPAIKPAKLGKLGDIGYSRGAESGVFQYGSLCHANIPFTVEVNMEPRTNDDKDVLIMMVNRSPITGVMNCYRGKANKLTVSGCNIYEDFTVPKEKVTIFVNVTVPYMPITSDGKAPDLSYFADALSKAFKRSAAGAKKTVATLHSGEKANQKNVILDCLDEARDTASGNGRYEYSLRRLFYAVRPTMLKVLGIEPNYNYFSNVIADYENDWGPIEGLYRDPRGAIIHPHTREEIPLGTRNVRKYQRPVWTFNKVLYCEKGGIFPTLQSAGWPERHDCALMTSQGFASGAARDLLDLLGADFREDLYIFCIHDADPAGTLIYQALTEATRARAARRVHVVNLGLEPQEALDMDLQVENYREDGSRRRPVADYVDWKWDDWLQTNRVELDAIPTDMLISWLDEKMEPYTQKIVPPTHVLKQTLQESLRSQLTAKLSAKILAEANLSRQVDGLLAQANESHADLDLERIVNRGLDFDDRRKWDLPIHTEAQKIADKIVKTP